MYRYAFFFCIFLRTFPHITSMSAKLSTHHSMNHFKTTTSSLEYAEHSQYTSDKQVMNLIQEKKTLYYLDKRDVILSILFGVCLLLIQWESRCCCSVHLCIYSGSSPSFSRTSFRCKRRRRGRSSFRRRTLSRRTIRRRSVRRTGSFSGRTVPR